jgi:hypothetical protein
VSELPDEPVPYQVVYSELVRTELRPLMVRARQRGLGQQVLAALKEIDRRLRIYPQFGQPLRDLVLEPAQLWIGVVPPLVVQYVLDEERRLVMVAGAHRAAVQVGPVAVTLMGSPAILQPSP